MASWADLPLDLLDLVVAGLPDPADRARCRVVCLAWHAAVRRCLPQAQQLPWIVFSDCRVIVPPDDRVGYPTSIPDKAWCKGSSNDWLLLGICQEDGRYYKYVLHNAFSLEQVPLPELDVALNRKYTVRKFLMRSTVNDFIAVITTNRNTPLIVILPGKGAWLPEPPAVPYIYIVDIAFLGDKLYGITKMENLVPFDLGLDEDGSPVVTIGRRVIRQPLEYEGIEWWAVSDDDDDDNSDLDDDNNDQEEGVVTDVAADGNDQEEEVADDDNDQEEEVAADVAADDNDRLEEEVMDVAIVADDEEAAVVLDVFVLDHYEEGGQAAPSDENGRKNINFLSCSHDVISDHEMITWHLVESCGKLLMVKPLFHILSDFSMFSIRQVEIFQADVDIGQWVPMANDLGGQALFISRAFCKSVSAPCGDVAEGDIYFIESGEAFNIKAQFSNPKRFLEPFFLGRCGTWLFPPELVL
jgi:hypothetical protein